MTFGNTTAWSPARGRASIVAELQQMRVTVSAPTLASYQGVAVGRALMV